MTLERSEPSGGAWRVRPHDERSEYLAALGCHLDRALDVLQASRESPAASIGLVAIGAPERCPTPACVTLAEPSVSSRRRASSRSISTRAARARRGSSRSYSSRPYPAKRRQRRIFARPRGAVGPARPASGRARRHSHVASTAPALRDALSPSRTARRRLAELRRAHAVDLARDAIRSRGAVSSARRRVSAPVRCALAVRSALELRALGRDGGRVLRLARLTRARAARCLLSSERLT